MTTNILAHMIDGDMKMKNAKKIVKNCEIAFYSPKSLHRFDIWERVTISRMKILQVTE